MEKVIQLLDHGYVRLVDHMGSDLSIVRAARVSHNADWRAGENEGSDVKLIHFLMKHRHSTPFESVALTFEVQAPIMVYREWHRHRTQSYNEMSARYTALPDLYYHCHVDEVIERAYAAQKTSNKQAGALNPVNEARIMAWVARDIDLTNMLEAHYQEGLLSGVPKELARKKMPVDHYSRMFATANLLNWFRFLELRLSLRAQKEIRVYAEAIWKLISEVCPIASAAFEETQQRWAAFEEWEKTHE